MAAIWSIPALALAHHDMDGETPSTMFQGLLSGFAHPVIGLDHLAIVLLLGAYCGALRQGLAPLVAFVGTSLVGCLLHVAKLDLPFSEPAIATTLVLVGLTACAALKASRVLTTAAFALCGVLHGYTYGESMVGAESTPLLAYLLGFSVVQFAIAALLFRLSSPKAATASPSPSPSQLTLLRVLGAAGLTVGLAALFVPFA
jgi:urease accessory protein